MSDQYLQYPTTVKALAAEIKAACDDYTARRLSNNQIREWVFWYATKTPELLFSAEKINPTVAIIIGKKRVKLLNDLLDGYGYQQKVGG